LLINVKQSSAAVKFIKFSHLPCLLRIARLYTFEMEFLERAKLPRWKGNMIRGPETSMKKEVKGQKPLNMTPSMMKVERR